MHGKELFLAGPTKESFWFFGYFCEQNQPIFSFCGTQPRIRGFLFFAPKTA